MVGNLGAPLLLVMAIFLDHVDPLISIRQSVFIDYLPEGLGVSLTLALRAL